MKFSMLLLLAGIASPSWAQTPAPSSEEYERRIRALEDRLVAVEAQLTVLMSERNPVPQRIVTATPAPPVETKPFEMPPELVPEIGKLGAEVGVLASAGSSPFKLDTGSFFGGFIDLPLVDRPKWIHGKISYEILVGLSRSKSGVQTTSNVAQIANLAVLNTVYPNGGLANAKAALAGTGPAPFPVTVASNLNLRLLQVVPFALKYTSTAFDRWRFRPYGVLGFGTYVTIHNEVPKGSGLRLNADLPPDVLTALSSSSPVSAALVAGQLTQSSELAARGVPGGNGNLDIGLQTGGGFELRVTRSLSIGFDGRFNKISGTNGDFGTYGSRIGIHF